MPWTLFTVHLTHGLTIIPAHRAKVDRTGALVFSVRVPFGWKPFLTFATGSWRSYHLSNAYDYDDAGRYQKVNDIVISERVGITPEPQRPL